MPQPLFSWKNKRPATKCSTTTTTTTNFQSLGLKSLVAESPPHCVHRAGITTKTKPSPQSSPALDARLDEVPDDNKVVNGDDEEEEDNGCWASYGRRGRGRKRFPPAIPLLARTENHPGHMPWILERTYRADGSLVIREVRVKHHEYLKARRSNGRLTLYLVEMIVDSTYDKEMTAVVHSESSSLIPRSTKSGWDCDVRFDMLSSSMPEPVEPVHG